MIIPSGARPTHRPVSVSGTGAGAGTGVGVGAGAGVGTGVGAGVGATGVGSVVAVGVVGVPAPLQAAASAAITMNARCACFMKLLFSEGFAARWARSPVAVAPDPFTMAEPLVTLNRQYPATPRIRRNRPVIEEPTLGKRLDSRKAIAE
jgi:hypothetical protein